MSLNGLHPPVHLGLKNGIGKVPIQPTPGAIRKPPTTKPKQRKSRTGCMTCKTKRLKCDETKPFCEQCTRKGIQCEGYAKNFKWKSFEDIQEQKKNAPVRRKSSVVKRPEDEDGGETMDYEFKPESARTPAQLMPPPLRGGAHHNSPFGNYTFGNSPSRNDFGSPNGFTNGIHRHSPLTGSSRSSTSASPMSIASLLNDTPEKFSSPQNEPVAAKADQAPAGLIGTIPVASSTPAPPAPLVTRTPPPLSSPELFWKEIELHPSDESDVDEDDVEELPREAFSDSNALIPNPKRRRLNSYVPSDAFLHEPLDQLELWDFYDKVTCSILSCKNAQGENPWRDELIARSNASEPLKHALFAMTSFHKKRYQPNQTWSMVKYGIGHTNAAFRALRQIMNDGKAFTDENNIAAMLVLSFSQVWDDPKLDGRAHVFGASKILEGVLRDLARKQKPISPFLRFLYNTWLYLDVLSSLSSGEDPLCLKLQSPILSAPSSPTFEGSSGSYSLQSEIDSLLGCAEDLFPLIARMSAVSNRLTDKVITLAEIPYIEEAIRIRDELREWKPPERSILQESSDVNCSLDDIIGTAEAYRLTALLHLFRTFPPLGKESQALADQILNRLLLIPRDSGSLCIHIWPLMAAGCEHTDPIKRQLIYQRFELLRERLKIGNVDRAIDLLLEVWRRKDAGDVTVGWDNLAKERGWLLLLG